MMIIVLQQSSILQLDIKINKDRNLCTKQKFYHLNTKKMYDNITTAPLLIPLLKPSTLVLTLQNGVSSGDTLCEVWLNEASCRRPINEAIWGTASAKLAEAPHLAGAATVQGNYSIDSGTDIWAPDRKNENWATGPSGMWSPRLFLCFLWNIMLKLDKSVQI